MIFMTDMLVTCNFALMTISWTSFDLGQLMGWVKMAILVASMLLVFAHLEPLMSFHMKNFHWIQFGIYWQLDDQLMSLWLILANPRAEWKLNCWLQVCSLIVFADQEPLTKIWSSAYNYQRLNYWPSENGNFHENTWNPHFLVLALPLALCISLLQGCKFAVDQLFDWKEKLTSSCFALSRWFSSRCSIDPEGRSSFSWTKTAALFQSLLLELLHTWACCSSTTTGSLSYSEGAHFSLFEPPDHLVQCLSSALGRSCSSIWAARF